MKRLSFESKVIFILSQEKWGKMLFSKHHYAIELGKRGNKVFFITFHHHDKKLKGSIEISDTGYQNVKTVDIRNSLSYFISSKERVIYNFFIRWFIPRLIKKLKCKPDIIWSFDLFNSLPIKLFPESSAKIFVPVDGPFKGNALKAAEGANLIVSVTREILQGYVQFSVPRHFINHGVADLFINNHIVPGKNSPLRIGYSGCLITNDLDHQTILALIERHPEFSYEFWGEFDYKNSEIHRPENIHECTKNFINKLQQLPNVKLHGAVPKEQLAAGLKQMDILLVCYDSGKNQSFGTNSHKILEYLASGKVVLSSRMRTYSKDFPNMLIMPENNSNTTIPELFDNIVENIDFHNSLHEQERRTSFARQFTYGKQIERIENFFNNCTN